MLVEAALHDHDEVAHGRHQGVSAPATDEARNGQADPDRGRDGVCGPARGVRAQAVTDLRMTGLRQAAGPEACTLSPSGVTATVTGMSWTSNS